MAQKVDLAEVKRINDIEDHCLKVFSAATWYAANGFYVVPLIGKQLPPAQSGVNYSHATKNQAQIERWFGKHGKFKGCNIGLACGMQDGIFAVDIDCKENKANGYETLALLEKEHGVLQAPIQSTPSGGRHYVFQWDEHGHSSAGKIGVAIDTRGGEELACKSHIVAWPSRVDGIDYEWEEGGDIPVLPEWVAAKLGTTWKAEGAGSIGSGRGNEEVGEGDEERKYSIDQIKNLLDHIDPNTLTYDQWLWTGQAIHSQHPTQEAYEMWDEWSQQGERYQPNECGVRWHGFEEGGRIRIGTLIHFAKEGGWLPPTMTPTEGSEFKDIIDEMNHDFAMVVLGGKARVLIERHEKPKDNELAAWYEISDIRDMQIVMMNDRVPVEDDKGNVKMLSKIDIWIAHERRRTYENGIIFAPGKPKELSGYFNVWRGFAVEPIEGDWSLFKDHILNIVCDGNEDHYNWLMDWMADGVQDPMNIKGTCVVMGGIEGCGKGTFATLYGKLFGSHYKHITNEDHLTGKFNAQLMDASLVFADEVTFGGNKKVAGTLKAFVSEKQLTCERKGVDAFQYRNCARLIIASNESWFIPAGANSRRWFVMAVSNKVANNKAYFTAIHKQMETQGGTEAMLYELQHRKITSDLTFAPVTEALEDQRSINSDPIGQYLMELAEEGSLVELHNKGALSLSPSGILGLNKRILFREYIRWAEDNNIPTKFKTPALFKSYIKNDVPLNTEYRAVWPMTGSPSDITPTSIDPNTGKLYEKAPQIRAYGLPSRDKLFNAAKIKSGTPSAIDPLDRQTQWIIPAALYEAGQERIINRDKVPVEYKNAFLENCTPDAARRGIDAI